MPDVTDDTPPLDAVWIPHDGDTCPVDPDTFVQVDLGDVTLVPDRASVFEWHKVQEYRVISIEEFLAGAFGYPLGYDDWLEHDDDEPPLVDATDTRPPHARLKWAEDAPDDIPPPLDDAWILHNGGPHPVPPDTLVWIDNGTGVFRGPAPASTFEWVDGEPERVHSYRRVVDPDAPTDHYRQGDIECIDAIRAALTDEEWRGYCKGNVLKYTWREKHKGGDGSLLKAQDYLRWALAGKAEDKA